MDPTSTCGSSPDPGIVYEAAMARRAKDQQQVEGAAALRLIDSAGGAGASDARPLPPDATISIRV